MNTDNEPKAKVENGKFDKFVHVANFLLCLSILLATLYQIRNNDPLKTERFNTLENTYKITSKIIDAKSNDSLIHFAAQYNDIYGNLLFIADSSMYTAAQVFKIDLNNQLKGTNLFQPDKYKISGQKLKNLCKAKVN
ncbi:MAG TPA: hypothetical protein PK605_15020 [Ignavibacteria bacterium]|nr:hypothetical protein [Bacteroidota bacterium]HRE09999.1 hypothetical protein [Ignavibacteria bacterium]HRF66934.1 hypothetical protein [Ignavibacteria bacterium]HRJ05713.1 hypothetical protein [Ignavibacteria bacterium]HRJ85498.1 hypothetical protein [Ignavibacteria bacterium]